MRKGKRDEHVDPVGFVGGERIGLGEGTGHEGDGTVADGVGCERDMKQSGEGQRKWRQRGRSGGGR